jgi:hypothetical protein
VVLSQSLQAVVEAMHTSKAQTNQALRKMRRVWVNTNVTPWYKVFAALTPTLFQREREVQQYPIPPRETARVMYPALPAMRSRSSAL